MLTKNVFTKSFDVSTKPRKFVRELLDDLVVKKPSISNPTKLKLGLSDNWEISHEPEPLEIELEEETDDNPINFFLNITDEEIFSINVKWDYDPLFSFINEFKSSDLFNTTTTRSEVSFPKQILNNVKNLKYDCISVLCTDMGLVNKSTITTVNNILNEHRNHIVYSLISRYDRFVASQSINSPDMIIMCMDKYLEELGASYTTVHSLD